MHRITTYLRWKRACLLAAAAFGLLAVPVCAQVAPSAYREAASLWAGGEYSNIHASFPYQSSQRLAGAGAFVDFNWRGRFGVEGDARFLQFGNYHGETESSYLAGPRYLLPRFRKFQPYAKFLVGEGKIHYPFDIGDASYLALAPGGGVNYRLSRKWLVRGEYEYQIWPSSPGFANEPNHPLTPNGFHLGIAYRILP